MKTHKHMTNLEIAKLFRLVTAAHEAKNENKFIIRAYDNAADSIEHATSEIRDLWERNHLKDIPGIGTNLASHLNELFKTGKVKHFEQVTKDLPAGMFTLLDVPGIGPKTAYKLSKHFKLTNTQTAIKKLQAIAAAGKIRILAGFGQQSEKDILEALRSFKAKDTSISLPTATVIAEKVVDYLKKHQAVIRVDTLGSLRRRAATVGDVDLAVATKDSQTVIDHFVKYPDIKKVLAQGSNTARFIHKSGNVQVDIKTQAPDKYGALLQHFTGSKNHNVHLRELALAKGLSLSEHGIKKSGRLNSYPLEPEFYRALDMDWIPPELREDAGEIEASLRHHLPKLVKLNDIKGDLHTHTNYGWISSHDTGSDSMEDLIKTASKLGYEYLSLGDHNPSTSSYSNSKIISEISKRCDKIEQLKSKSSLKLLKTLEIDIKPDGQLAITEKALEYLDFVVVSIHSVMNLNKTDMTKRVLAGLSHPKAKILGHPTGRLLGQREGYELDWDKLFEFCVKNHKFLEINAQPSRLDLPDTLVRDAIKHQVKFVIDTDSHNVNSLHMMRFGVDVARRGWAQKQNIINTLPWKEFSVTINI